MSEKLSERLVSLLSSKALSWEEYADIYQVMEDFAARHPQRTAELLPSFYSLVRNPGFNADVAPRAAKVYGLLVQDMNPETAVESFDVLLESGQKRFALRPQQRVLSSSLGWPIRFMKKSGSRRWGQKKMTYVCIAGWRGIWRLAQLKKGRCGFLTI